SVSIDHGVMEHATRVVTVPASVGWDDVGSWAALPAVLGTRERDNTRTEPSLVLDGDRNIVFSDDGTLIATVGVSDLVVIKSGDAVLVLPRSRAQDVRSVIAELAADPKLARHL